MNAIPQQRDLFTKRYRKLAPPEPSELQIQISLIQQLRLSCRRGVTYWHTPNGELRDKRFAAKLKAMGTLAGVSDLMFVFPKAEPLLFLEIKAKGRKPTPDQKHFGEMMLAAGHRYEWTDSIDDAMRILKRYKVFK
jgi:hypothetical protein